jgi:hypothetical protein
MPYSGSFNTTIGGRRLEAVKYNWQDLYSEKRRGQVGWGVAIELPAVLDMIRLVADGTTTADDLVKHLETIAEKLRTEFDALDRSGDDEDEPVAWGADCPASGCALCDGAREEYEATKAQLLVQQTRLQDPITYPYAAGEHTLHRSTCRTAQDSIGKPLGLNDWRNSPERQTQDLREFAHHGYRNNGWAAQMVALNPAETTHWISNRVGPRGGAQYKLCKVCHPELPQA